MTKPDMLRRIKLDSHACTKGVTGLDVMTDN